MKKTITLFSLLVMLVLTASAQLSEVTPTTTGKLKQAEILFSDLSMVMPMRPMAAGVTLPWLETFEQESPTAANWTYKQTAGTSFEMNIGKIRDLDAVSGVAYMISGYNGIRAMNSWAFSPGVTLTAGTTYYIGVFVYTPGFQPYLDEVRVTVGTASNEVAQTTVIIDKSGANAEALDAWKLEKGTFTPATTGTYYFALSHCTSAIDVNAVAFDDFSVQTEPIKDVPVIKYLDLSKTLWSVTNESPIAYVSEKVGITHSTEVVKANSISWSVNNGATVLSPQASSTVVKYPADGEYQSTITATNQEGNISQSYTYNVKKISAIHEDFVTSIAPWAKLTASLAWTSDQLPVFGLNNNYREFGEIFTFPTNAKIKSLAFSANEYTMSGSDLDSPLKFIFYPIKDGYILISDVAEYQTTIKGAFGDPSSPGQEVPQMLVVDIPNPFEVATDSVLVTVVFDASLKTSATCKLVLHGAYGATGLQTNTFWVYVSPESGEGSFVPMPSYAGTPCGMAMYPGVEFNVTPSNINNVSAVNITISPNPAKDVLKINGFEGNAKITISNASGVAILSTEANNSAVLNVESLNRGIYFVTVRTANETITMKFMKE